MGQEPAGTATSHLNYWATPQTRSHQCPFIVPLAPGLTSWTLQLPVSGSEVGPLQMPALFAVHMLALYPCPMLSQILFWHLVPVWADLSIPVHACLTPSAHPGISPACLACCMSNHSHCPQLTAAHCSSPAYLAEPSSPSSEPAALPLSTAWEASFFTGSLASSGSPLAIILVSSPFSRPSSHPHPFPFFLGSSCPYSRYQQPRATCCWCLPAGLS